MTVKTMGRISWGARRPFAQHVQEWLRRYRSRRHLLSLDERLLEDIGTTREAVVREAAKPFWEA